MVLFPSLPPSPPLDLFLGEKANENPGRRLLPLDNDAIEVVPSLKADADADGTSSVQAGKMEVIVEEEEGGVVKNGMSFIAVVVNVVVEGSGGVVEGFATTVGCPCDRREVDRRGLSAGRVFSLNGSSASSDSTSVSTGVVESMR